MSEPSGVDVAGLVDEGLLDLVKVFEWATWSVVDDQPDDLDGVCADGYPVMLEQACVLGIRPYRWAIRRSEETIHGEPRLDAVQAVMDGLGYADSVNEDEDEGDFFDAYRD